MLLVPTVVATWSFAGVMGTQVAFSAAERAGVTVVSPALAALSATVAGQSPDLDALRAAVDAAPDLDSFYVMDALVVQLPKALLAAAQSSLPPEGELA